MFSGSIKKSDMLQHAQSSCLHTFPIFSHLFPYHLSECTPTGCNRLRITPVRLQAGARFQIQWARPFPNGTCQTSPATSCFGRETLKTPPNQHKPTITNSTKSCLGLYWWETWKTVGGNQVASLSDVLQLSVIFSSFFPDLSRSFQI